MFVGFAIQFNPETILATEPEFCGPSTRSEVISDPRATPETEPAAIDAVRDVSANQPGGIS